MPKGKSWNFTPKRQKTAIDMLVQQYSITLIAMHFGIGTEAMGRKLKEEGINVSELQMAGVRKVRANLFANLDDIMDPKDQAKARLEFLKHYDKSDDVAQVIPVVTFGEII